ncbi:oligosaccharide flippase family protein [Paenibacillus sp. JX-17]|uniref:Oligosaccharide flippase family protein n=1 Tax=Paenibacillus lacisoli TaxID=3064525 RepID=A0ABT9CD54_9BACL|nr:oligosaccharide flippase family protein [Paenibacillus sp. JX-17]MDO7907204.1 oligosaccharide flippase family protein [Paenibacillus sp. JX-17]
MNKSVELLGKIFKGNFSALLAGNLIYAASQWGMIMSIAKLGNPAMVGQFSLALALIAPLILFSNFQLRNFQATDAKDEYAFTEYFRLRMLMSILSLLCVAVIAVSGDYSSVLRLVILFVGISKVIESVSDIIFGLFQKHEQMHWIARSMIMKGLSSVAVLSVVLLLTDSIVWSVVGMSCAWLLILVLYDIRNAIRVLKQLYSRTGQQKKYFWEQVNLRRIWKLGLLTIPLGIVATLDSLMNNIPRYRLQAFGGEEMLGYYAAIAYIMVAGGTFITALIQAFSPKLSVLYHQHLDRFRKDLLKLSFLAGCIGITGILISLAAGRPILNLLYSKEYGQHSEILTIIMLASTIWFISSCLGAGLTISRNMNVQVPIYVVSCASVFVSAFFLIPGYGMSGAAWSIVIGMLVRGVSIAVSLFIVIRRKMAAQPIAKPGEAVLNQQSSN